MKQSADRWIMVANQEMKQLLTELLIYLSRNEKLLTAYESVWI